MTSVNCNSYIFPTCSVFLGKDWRIQQRISTRTWRTAHQIIPFIPIIKAHPTQLHTSEQHIGDARLVIWWNVSLCGAEKAFSYYLRSKLDRITKKGGEMGFEVQFWCNIMKRAAQQSQINSPAHVKWFNVTLWCDTHIWTWKLWKGTSYIHRRTTGRVWPFLIQRQFFTLIAFCPLI